MSGFLLSLEDITASSCIVLSNVTALFLEGTYETRVTGGEKQNILEWISLVFVGFTIGGTSLRFCWIVPTPVSPNDLWSSSDSSTLV